jgi:hypothetical protein
LSVNIASSNKTGPTYHKVGDHNIIIFYKITVNTNPAWYFFLKNLPVHSIPDDHQSGRQDPANVDISSLAFEALAVVIVFLISRSNRSQISERFPIWGSVMVKSGVASAQRRHVFYL